MSSRSDSSPTCPVTPPPAPLTLAPTRTTNPSLSTRAPPSYLRVPPISSATPATRPPSPNNGPTESRRQRRPSYFRNGPAVEGGTWAGSFGQVVERDNRVHMKYPSSPGRPVHSAPTFLVSLPPLLSAPMAVPLLMDSTDSPPPSATAGLIW